MMILNSVIVQIAIVIGLVVIFIVSFLINKKIKVDGVKKDECDGCSSHDCVFRVIENEKAKASEQDEKK